jgi:hypothetical protein
MTWTVNNNLRDHIAGVGSVESAMSGGVLKIYDALAVLLSENSIGTVSTADNVVTVPFNVSTVEVGVVNLTATNATIENSLGAILLSTDNVGLVGSDIPFNDNTGWNAGDSVAPGSATLTLAVAIA